MRCCDVLELGATNNIDRVRSDRLLRAKQMNEAEEVEE
jgi:hypothetical protein